MEQILELADIHTYYGESHVLWGVSLKLEKGSVVAILGRNGMGKTTIIHSIIGFTPPRQGKVLVKGKDVTNLQPNRIARMGVALVPQGRRIFSSLSVREYYYRVQRWRPVGCLDIGQNIFHVSPVKREVSPQRQSAQWWRATDVDHQSGIDDQS